MKITRRSAIKAISALAMFPTIHLRPEIDRERLLAAFAEKPHDRSLRYDMDQPFGVGSLTYATDARYMARTELAKRVEVGKRHLPPVEDAWNAFWNPSRFAPLDLPDPYELQRVGEECSELTYGQCPFCGDRRISLGDTYPEFTQDGQLADLRLRALDYDVDHNTIRDSSCQHCKGLPYRGRSLLRVCGVLHQYWRLKPIAAIPGVQVCESRSEPRCLLFRGDGFEGMSMGVVE